MHILPAFEANGHALVLEDDLASLRRILRAAPCFRTDEFIGRTLFSKGIPARLRPRPDTYIDLVPDGANADPTFYAALRNLVSAPPFRHRGALGHAESIPYFLRRLVTSSPSIRDYAYGQQLRAAQVTSSRASQFANSAYYMVSKRGLAGFLVEALSSVVASNATVIDLMCGSGAAAAAFSKVWRTIASDAQEFCRILARVQGGGFSASRAEKILKHVVPCAHDHARALQDHLNEILRWEDSIFHGNVGPHLLAEYARFLETIPTYPRLGAFAGWNPSREVETRKADPTVAPYCLFTAYFANIYFGVRQCVEIDSIRFAISTIDDDLSREWALGALIASASALGTTYGGHFAQPRTKGASDLTLSNLSGIIERRAYSISHEFAVRLLSLAEESERAKRPIETVDGPWERALVALDKMVGDVPTGVYLDAPYTREEYSRYYHVLETIVAYSYPSAVGQGKVPDKRQGQRFRSEFFSRTPSRIRDTLARVLTEVLLRGWTCAWSYSDSGIASIPSVIDAVRQNVDCSVRSYATPYEHRPQSGSYVKKVKEYLLILSPRGKRRPSPRR